MNKVGLLLEGGIDEILFPPLLEKVFDDVPYLRGRRPPIFHVPFPLKGYGEIPKNVQTLVRLYQQSAERERIGCNLFVIVHDYRKTEDIQRQIRRILRHAHGFPSVYGLAIQVVEAWVLADIEHLNRQIFRVQPCPQLPFPPERDPNPEKTLNELFVQGSPAIEFDRWNCECARIVAPHIRHSQVARRCPRGFGALVRSLKEYRPSAPREK